MNSGCYAKTGLITESGFVVPVGSEPATITNTI